MQPRRTPASSRGSYRLDRNRTAALLRGPRSGPAEEILIALRLIAWTYPRMDYRSNAPLHTSMPTHINSSSCLSAVPQLYRLNLAIVEYDNPIVCRVIAFRVGQSPLP